MLVVEPYMVQNRTSMPSSQFFRTPAHVPSAIGNRTNLCARIWNPQIDLSPFSHVFPMKMAILVCQTVDTKPPCFHSLLLSQLGWLGVRSTHGADPNRGRKCRSGHSVAFDEVWRWCRADQWWHSQGRLQKHPTVSACFCDVNDLDLSWGYWDTVEIAENDHFGLICLIFNIYIYNYILYT